MKELALEIIESMVYKDELGRATGIKGQWLYTELLQHFNNENKVNYETIHETVKCLHCDFLVDYENSQRSNEATVRLTEAGLEYYRAKTRTFI